MASVKKAYPALSAETENLTQACLHRVEDSQIEFELIEGALLRLYQLSGDPAFGWKVGWSLCTRTQLHRTVTIYSDLQATIGDGLLVTQHYPELLVFPGMQYLLEPLDNTIRLHIVSTGYPFINFGQFAMLCMAALFRAGRNIADDFDLRELVADPELLDKNLIQQYTKAILRAEHGKFSLAVETIWLQHPKPTADTTLAEALKPILDRETEKLRKPDNLVDQIEKSLRKCDHPQQFALKDFSNQVGLSEASIRRRLAELEVNFSDMVQNYLRTIAIQFLMDAEETVDSITYRLGFSERAAFERAFRRWYGISPAQFREKYGAMVELGDAAQSSFGDVELSALPKVVQQVIELIDSQQCGVDDLTRVIKNDMVLSARLLSAANSAFYGAGKVKDLEDAIGRVLGLNRVRNLALALAVKEVFPIQTSDFDIQRLWFVSVFAEYWLNRLQRQIKWQFDLPFNEFINAIQFGLVGHLLIAQSNLPLKKTWIEMMRSDSLTEILSWERKQLGMTVFTISSLVLARWGMSSSICKFLLAMSPQQYDGPDKSSLPLAALMITDMALASYHHKKIIDDNFNALATAMQIDRKLLVTSFGLAEQSRAEMDNLIQQLF